MTSDAQRLDLARLSRWPQALLRADLPEAVRDRYRGALAAFFAYCREHRVPPSVAVMREYLRDPSREASRDALRWLVRTVGVGGASRPADAASCAPRISSAANLPVPARRAAHAQEARMFQRLPAGGPDRAGEPVSFPEWNRVLAREALAPQQKELTRRAVVGFLQHCKASRSPASVALARQYLAT